MSVGVTNENVERLLAVNPSVVVACVACLALSADRVGRLLNHRGALTSVARATVQWTEAWAWTLR